MGSRRILARGTSVRRGTVAAILAGSILGLLALPGAAQSPSTAGNPSGGGDPVQAACDRAQVSLNAPSNWTGPESGPAPQAGKRLAIIPVAALTEGANRPARAMAEAATLLGWEPTIIDGKGDPSVQLQAVNSAVDGGFDGIIMIFIDPNSVSEGVNRAKEAGIPVVTLGVPAYTPDRDTTWGWIPDISHDWIYTGEVIGDYMICDSGGNVNALLLVGAETIVVLYGQFAGTESVLTDPAKCPNCKVQRQDFTIAAIETQPAQAAIAAVQADPTINWIWCYDFCMARTATQMIAAGVQGDIKGAGFDCNAENIQLIRDHKVQVVCIADPRDWEGWAAVDTMNRLFNGEQPVEQSIPVRLYDVNNVDEFTDADVAGGWQGNFDYKSQYRKIWGIDEGSPSPS
jgi:ribose transport system substrate-binding protein